MKNIKIVLIVLTIALVQWLLIGLVIYLLSDDVITYKHVLRRPEWIFFYVVLGWVLPVWIGTQLYDEANPEE